MYAKLNWNMHRSSIGRYVGCLSHRCRRSTLRLLVTIGNVPAALVIILLAMREPAYQGKALSQWVEAYVTTQDTEIQATGHDPAEAIAHIGSDAIPYLLMWIRYER